MSEVEPDKQISEVSALTDGASAHPKDPVTKNLVTPDTFRDPFYERPWHPAESATRAHNAQQAQAARLDLGKVCWTLFGPPEGIKAQLKSERQATNTFLKPNAMLSKPTLCRRRNKEACYHCLLVPKCLCYSLAIPNPIPYTLQPSQTLNPKT